MKALDTHSGTVLAVNCSGAHTFSKPSLNKIRLLAGLGVEGDAHMGATVQHRSHVARDPGQPNLRQVHLIHAALFEELAQQGFRVMPGQLGENITTQGIDVLGLPVGTKLFIGESAVVEVTGLRNPCGQIDAFQSGLLERVVVRDQDGRVIRKTDIMGIVLTGGEVRPGDVIHLMRPKKPHVSLQPV